MFIEVYLTASIAGEPPQDWHFVFNSQLLSLIVINTKHPCLTLEFTTHKSTFEFLNMDDTRHVFLAIQHAITGIKNVKLREGLGFVSPIKRPFDDETTLLPSAYCGDPE